MDRPAPEVYEAYITSVCPDSECNAVPKVEQLPVVSECETFFVDFSPAYGRPFFRTFDKNTGHCETAVSIDSRSCEAIGHPTAIQPECGRGGYRAWKDEKGRWYYEELETAETTWDLPGVLHAALGGS
eukprot:Skav200873  [mRNA]  locus=scaffold4346:5838:8505:- [translate_table: standard]